MPQEEQCKVIQNFQSATKGTIQSDTKFQVLYLQKIKKNNQQKKQYKAIQKFSSATKGTIQIAANFQVLFLQTKKNKNN